MDATCPLGNSCLFEAHGGSFARCARPDLVAITLALVCVHIRASRAPDFDSQDVIVVVLLGSLVPVVFSAEI